MLSEYEIPELDTINLTDLDEIDSSKINELDKLIPLQLKVLNAGEISTATTTMETLKKEYNALVKKQIPKYTFAPTSSGVNDYTKDVIWNNNDLISNVGGAYYVILDKLLVDSVLKFTFSKDKKDFIHRQLNITPPDTTNADIKPVYEAYTYLNEQKELREAQNNIIKENTKVRDDLSKLTDHPAATAAITTANAEINKIDKLIEMAQKNYDKMIGMSADADIDDKNIQILANAKTNIDNYEAALVFLTNASGNILNAKTTASASANANVLQILNELTPGANDGDNITNLTATIATLKNELNTATGINALRKAIRDNSSVDNNTIITKIDPSISTDAKKIIEDALTEAITASNLNPLDVLTSLKSTIPTFNMVGGGRSSRRNSSRTSRHDRSRTSRHDNSSTSRHSGW